MVYRMAAYILVLGMLVLIAMSSQPNESESE